MNSPPSSQHGCHSLRLDLQYIPECSRRSPSAQMSQALLCSVCEIETKFMDLLSDSDPLDPRGIFPPSFCTILFTGKQYGWQIH